MRGMVSKDSQFDQRDFLPYTYPSLRELKKLRYQSLCLGSFIPWNTKKQSETIMKNWVEGDEVEGMPPEIYDYEKIECHMYVRDYIKYQKGYSQATQMTVLDIRNGRMTKNEAQNIQEYEGKPPSLEIFLEYLIWKRPNLMILLAKL